MLSRHQRLLSSSSSSSFNRDLTVTRLKEHLAAGRINAICAILRDGAARQQHQQQTSSPPSSSLSTSPLPPSSSSSSSLALLLQHQEDEAPGSTIGGGGGGGAGGEKPRQREMRLLLRRCIHQALTPDFHQPHHRYPGTKTQRDPISAASWTVLANVAVAHGMWVRSLQIFDKLIGMEKQPSPHAVAQTLRPGNEHVIRKWCVKSGAKFDIVTGMRVLVEYSDDWAAALRLALNEEKRWESHQPPPQQSGNNDNNKNNNVVSGGATAGGGGGRGTTELFSLGALIPFLANGGHWRTASSVLGHALAQGSLVTDSLIRMIIRSTAQRHTWVSCLALTSSLSRCFAIQPADGTEAAASDLQSTMRAVAAVCPSWDSACSMLSVCRRAGAPLDDFIVGAAMERCQRGGKWAEASAVMRCAVEEGVAMNTAEAGKRLVESFRAESQWTGALRALSWMSSADSAAAAAGLLSTIELCADAGQWRAAAEIGSKVLRMGSETSAPARPVSSYVALIDVLSSAGRWQEAAHAFTEMAHDSTVRATNAQSCETVLKACRDDWHAALCFFEKAVQWEPRVVLPVTSYETVVRVCMAAARWRQAVEVLRLQRHNGVNLEAAHFRSGMWASAIMATTATQHAAAPMNRSMMMMMTTQGGQQQRHVSSSASSSWITCLKFYRNIPVHRRTTGDTEVVARVAAALASPTQADALSRALMMGSSSAVGHHQNQYRRRGGGGGGGGHHRKQLQLQRQQEHIRAKRGL